jgi:hypothetical protein
VKRWYQAGTSSTLNTNWSKFINCLYFASLGY